MERKAEKPTEKKKFRKPRITRPKWNAEDRTEDIDEYLSDKRNFAERLIDGFFLRNEDGAYFY